MTTVLPFSNNTIGVYAYEGFSYTISNPNPSLFTLQTVSNSSGFGASPSALYFTKNGNTSYTFAVTDLSTNLTAGRTESFVLTLSGSTLISSNTVNVGPGRFLDGSGIPLSNQPSFYKNEAIPPIRLKAPSFTLKPLTSIPSLPPGLSFTYVASNIYDITGVPSAPIASSNYQIIGVESGGSKVITTRFNMSVSNERILLNLSNSPIISGMQIGTPISTRMFTSLPPIGSSVVRYTFPTLPNGLFAADRFGGPVTSPYFPVSDPSYTMLIAGTPTLEAANAFRSANAGTNGLEYTIQVSRTAPTPLLSNSQILTFSFGETVLFDQSTIPVLYKDVPLVLGQHFFRAGTFFTSNVPITNITSTGLPPGLSLVFDASSSRANIIGTPTTAGSADYTFRATNSNGTIRDYVTPITVITDTVSFISPSPAIDTCYSFILSRPVDQPKDSYYSYPITFAAEAGSKLPVVLSAPELAGTGLSLSNGTIVGFPTRVQPLTTLSISATVTGSPATATRTVKFSILDDAFSFGTVASSNFDFIQNIPVTPFQIPVTTLSGRNVINFTTVGGPDGISINPAGLISGTALNSSPTSGLMSVFPTTGYSSGAYDFSYTLFPDNILMITPQTAYSYIAGDPISIQVTGATYSGANVDRYTLSSPYGPTIDPISGLISGNWTDSIPPNALLPESGTLVIGCRANNVTDTLTGTFTVNPIIKNASFAWVGSTFYTYNDVSWTADPKVFGGNGTDIVIKNTNVNGNFVVATASNVVYRSSTISEFLPITTDQDWCSTLAFKPEFPTWWCSGLRTYDDAIPRAAVIHSENNAQSWDFLSLLETRGRYMLTRDSNSNIGNAYLRGGIALGYGEGVLMAGGLTNDAGSPVMLRSLDEGLSWVDVSEGAFEKETAYFNLDVSSMWIATGSSGYKSFDYRESAPDFTVDTDTIKYSTDYGQHWSNATGGFTMFGYDVIYASNTWVALGVDGISNVSSSPTYKFRLKYSVDGILWNNATPFSEDISLNPPFIAPMDFGPINYDGSNWNLFRTDGSDTKLYSTSSISNGASQWAATTVSSLVTGSNPVVAYTRPQYLRTTGSDNPNINIYLYFDLALGEGPVISSPTDRSFLLYQYVPMSIQLVASQVSGNAYFFITGSELPPGLTFNPLTNLITGKPADNRQYSTRVFAQDASGITLEYFNFSISVPRVVRKQDGAGAYTSLLKQYTEVLSAQSGRDQRMLPNQTTALGEFMSPVPPTVVTKVFSTDCDDCPPVGAALAPDVSGSVVIESTVPAFTTVAAFIDGNAIELLDGGSA